MRRISVRSNGEGIEVTIKSKIGELNVIKGSKNGPLLHCRGLFDDPKPDKVPREVLHWLRMKGYEPIVLGRAMFTPTLLAVKGKGKNCDVIACDFERRNFRLERHDTIRVPLKRFSAERLALVPLRYYFSQSSTGRTYVIGVRRVLEHLVEGNAVIDDKGRMFIEIPFEEWHPIVGGDGGENDDVVRMLKRIESLLERMEGGGE